MLISLVQRVELTETDAGDQFVLVHMAHMNPLAIHCKNVVEARSVFGYWLAMANYSGKADLQASQAELTFEA